MAKRDVLVIWIGSVILFAAGVIGIESKLDTIIKLLRGGA